MANPLFYSVPFDFNEPQDYFTRKVCEENEGDAKKIDDQLYHTQSLVRHDNIGSKLNVGTTYEESITCDVSNFGGGFNTMRKRKLSDINNQSSDCSTMCSSSTLDPNKSQSDAYSMLMRLYGIDSSNLSLDENGDVELAHHLYAAANKISNQDYDCASKLLNHCNWVSSFSSKPVQRFAFYFTEALCKRIKQETGKIAAGGLEEQRRNQMREKGQYSLRALSCHRDLPLRKMILFTGVCATVENEASARKVHVIDLDIKSGVQWMVMLRVLSAHSTRY
ncbi:Transcription factor GRAS [Dillenia turbinata]|uniref:Transcription factor GRAS n=1 Tax=Dillenia turbinata TaxID=194707 RepID=A0AAN8ZKB8_9MAGN